MLISVVNHTAGKLTDEKVQEGVRAVNRQIAHDFNPYWHLGAELRLEGALGKDPDKKLLPELRGDAIIYLWDEVDVDEALGYHEANAAGIPFGFVFTELVKKFDEPWTVTLSHEALELIADPEVNLLVAGPHPGGGGFSLVRDVRRRPGRKVQSRWDLGIKLRAPALLHGKRREGRPQRFLRPCVQT